MTMASKITRTVVTNNSDKTMVYYPSPTESQNDYVGRLCKLVRTDFGVEIDDELLGVDFLCS